MKKNTLSLLIFLWLNPAFAQDSTLNLSNCPNPELIEKTVQNKKGQIFAVNNTGLIYRSENKGQTWEQKNTGIPADYTFIDLIVLESDNLIIGYLDKIKDKGFIFKSTDAGEKWFTVNNIELWWGNEFLKGFKGRIFIVNSSTNYTDDEFKTIKKIQFDKKNKDKHPKNILINPKGYLLAFDLDSSLIVFKSIDNGLTWLPINKCKLFNWFDSRAVTHASINSNGEITIIKNKELFVSIDDGKTWECKGKSKSVLP